jgi:hypothetical protein
LNAFPCILFVTLAPSDGDARQRVLILVGVLIAICLVGGAFILILRRRLFRKESDAAAAGSLFEQLRGMRDRGEISPAEFEKTRQAMIRRIRGSTESPISDPASKKV